MPTLSPRQQRAAVSRRRTWKVVLAIVGSLLLHVVALCVLGWLVPRWPRTPLHGGPIKPLRLTILPANSPTPTPAPGVPNGQPTPEYIRTDDDQAAKDKVVDPNFISDKDTLAAAELTAQGDKPLPTQEGKPIPTLDFATRPYRPGDEASQAASAPPAQAAPAQSQVDAKPEDQQPKATPKPENPRKSRKDPTSQATPAPHGELAVATPQPSAVPEPPAPTPEKPTDSEANTPPQPMRQQPSNTQNPSLVPSTGLPKKPGYQPQTVQSKVQGSINNRGKPSVQALGTPLGRYIKSVQDSIGALWYFRTEQKLDVLSAGEVKTHFYITSSGRLRQAAVVNGNQNSALANISISSVMEADIPPIPPDVAQALPNNELEMDLTFGMY